MKSKNAITLFEVYKCLNIKNRNVYTYDLSWKDQSINGVFYYSSFSEAVSDASVEALEEAEIQNLDITVWIYEVDDSINYSQPCYLPLKGFKISPFV